MEIWVVLLALIFGYWLIHQVYFGTGLLIYLSLLLIGHLNTWWLPYLFGWPKVFAEDTTVDHKATVRFLPPRDNRPVPDISYCIFGILLVITYILTFKDVMLSRL